MSESPKKVKIREFGGSLVVTIPATLVRKLGLNKGQSVMITEAVHSKHGSMNCTACSGHQLLTILRIK
jgi:hypothetical protein